MGLSGYCKMLEGTSKAHRLSMRRQIVQEAQKEGIRPTANRYGMSKNTVKTWLRRFEEEGNKGLEDRRKGPKALWNKTPEAIEKKVIEARQQVPCYGPKRLKYFFDLPCSLGAIQRILKAHGLSRKHKKKYQKKNDLRAAKASLKSLTHLQMDVKHLSDITNYWGQRGPLNLPKFQYTVRDTKSGMLFLGFSTELSELNARTMINYVLTRLRAQMPHREIIIQTDNGVEFSGTTRHFERSTFSKLVVEHEAKHTYIPPGMCNANGDVESSHCLIEKEFFDLEKFTSREDFIHKAESYRLFFNLERPNFSKSGKPPWLVAHEDWPDSDIPIQACLTPTIDLDRVNTFFNTKEYNLKGQYSPVSAEFSISWK